MIYNGIKKNGKIKEILPDDVKLNIHFVDGCFVELSVNNNDDYLFEFIKDNQVDYSVNLKNNHWAKTNKKFFVDWAIRITKNGEVKEYKYDCENKRVYIAFESKSLGDTLAWFPYVEEFRKKHNCQVIVSTFHNDLFTETYKEIIFVNPGTVVTNLYAMYSIGWFYDGDNVDYNRHPSDFKLLPLQRTASDILGLEYSEIIPDLVLKDIPRVKQVSIAIHSTAQAKYWNNPNGWDDVVNYLKKQGYEVVLLSNEPDGFMGNKQPIGVRVKESGNIMSVIEELQKSEFFIGIGSGLSWLSWATKTPTVLISGFSEEYTEMKENVYRVSPNIDNKQVCIGCFNKFKLDGSDWNWCPINKGTDKQFECTKTIDSQSVINLIENQFIKK